MLNKIKQFYKRITLSQEGLTLIELVIYLSLIVIVLTIIYNFYYFSSRSSMKAQAEAEVLQDARNVMMQMEREIRQANRPRNLSNLPDEINPDDLPYSKGVVVDSGSHMVIYSYIGDFPKKISYKVIEVGDYSVMKRSVVDPHIEEPDNWQRVIEHIITLTDQDYFIIEDNKKIVINFSMMDAKGHLPRAMNFTNTYTVRGKEAMQ